MRVNGSRRKTLLTIFVRSLKAVSYTHLSPAIRLPLSYLNASIAMSGFGMIVVVVCKILEELTASKERMMDEI